MIHLFIRGELNKFSIEIIISYKKLNIGRIINWHLPSVKNFIKQKPSEELNLKSEKNFPLFNDYILFSGRGKSFYTPGILYQNNAAVDSLS
jgi:hypothetical protein